MKFPLGASFLPSFLDTDIIWSNHSPLSGGRRRASEDVDEDVDEEVDVDDEENPEPQGKTSGEVDVESPTVSHLVVPQHIVTQ